MVMFSGRRHECELVAYTVAYTAIADDEAQYALVKLDLLSNILDIDATM